MKTEKEKILEKAGCKKCKYKKTCNGSCALYRLYENGFEPDLLEAGKAEAIKQMQEVIEKMNFSLILLYGNPKELKMEIKSRIGKLVK